ncbi:AAA family ATPase [Bradyrhizobium sp. F1.13.3]|uniref:AAA family ATPase n=1 Tax=Bradyrhizobium sp. F1.13.3 TaxID=3156351 RepID=UPI00339981A7
MTNSFRHTTATYTGPVAADDQPDVDLPDSEEASLEAPPVSGPPLPPAETALLRAAFENAITKPQRARIAASDRLAVVVLVPDPGWVRATERFFMAEFGNGWSAFARDGSQKLRDKSIVGNDEVTAVLTRGHCAVGIAASIEILPAALTTVADVTVRIPPPTSPVLRRALRLFCGCPARLVLPDDLCAGLDFHAIASCFRRGSTATEVAGRLRSASSRRTVDAGERLPDLESAIEYGPLRTWGLELSRDLKLYRQGLLPWQALSRGICVHGESGVGKTVGIRAVALACRVPLIATSIGQLFAQSSGDLGGVVSAWRSTLASAAAAGGPSILLLDEVDGLPNRSNLSGRNSDFWQPVVADFLTTLDGAMANARDGIVVAATTNHIGHVDPALLRPGRLERVIELGRPDLAGIINILGYHVAGDLTVGEIERAAHLLEGTTPAEVMRAVRDARRLARTAERSLRLGDLETVLAPQVEIPLSRLFRIAVHECGHAVAALAIGWGTVRGIVIADQGGALGRTVIQPPTDDLPTRTSVEARATMLLAGRQAERIYLNEPGMGSGGDDLSDMALVSRLIGGLHVCGLGRSRTYLAPFSETLAVLRTDRHLRRVVERDIRRLERRALSIVRANRAALLAMAERLMESRHLSGAEAREIFEAFGTPAEHIDSYNLQTGRTKHARSYH